jgi:hypothetical protein
MNLFCGVQGGEMAAYVPSILQPLIHIINRGNTPKTLLENTAITIGYTRHPQPVRPLMHTFQDSKKLAIEKINEILYLEQEDDSLLIAGKGYENYR